MTEDQQSLVELIRDFMTREVKPHVLEWEKEGHYPKEIIQMGIDMGLHMMQVPEEYGGKMCIRDRDMGHDNADRGKDHFEAVSFQPFAGRGGEDDKKAEA